MKQNHCTKGRYLTEKERYQIRKLLKEKIYPVL